MWPNVDADIPQRTRIAEKHQEWGHNSQKGATCRRHNELFVSKRFKATDVHGGRGDSCQEVKAKCPPKFTKSTLKKDDQTNFPKKGDCTLFDRNIPSVSTQVDQTNFPKKGDIGGRHTF
ncbi:peptidyl-prolyl cis-trans isomerase FKBP3-like isoform X2 [Stigmatopora argus]